jgi:hypothetical protein|nr:MAG TPA: hypothetical protein [Caudoviricetes sp.]
MRKSEFSGATVEYPDMIAFAFNPIIINVYGKSFDWVKVIIEDVQSGVSHEESREMYGESVFFDISSYIQGFFDTVDSNKVDYSQKGASDSRLGRKLDISIDVPDDSFGFSVFVMWGAMRVGERFNGSRKLTWFKNFPFSVGLYSGASGSVEVTVDGEPTDPIMLTGQGLWNLIPQDINAVSMLVFNLPGSDSFVSVFDHTFDLTFKGLTNIATRIECAIDNSDCGVYLRWVNRHGMYCYWLFLPGDETRQVVNDGEFIRNNMQSYSFIDGYHGGTGRKQRKSENDTLLVCAPLVDGDTYDFLFELATSPVVDMFSGYQDGVAQWKGVNVSVENYVKTSASLQDFVCTIILPELNLQSL